jgi:rRNA maturation endonuclease Nob1
MALIPNQYAVTVGEIADMIRECIQCFNMYDEPDNKEDTCDFCQGNLRRR